MTRHSLLASALLTGYIVTGCSTPQADLSPRREAVVITTPALQVNPVQPGVDQIVIERLDLVQPGFIVIRADDDGKPGAVISHSVMLERGRHESVGVNIDPARAGAQVIAVVHADNGNVLFEYPGADGPMLVGDQMMMRVIKLR